MTQPRVQAPSTPAAGQPAVNPADERAELLQEEILVGEPNWSDSSFRRNHLKLYFALRDLRKFMDGDPAMTPEKLQSSLQAWTESPGFSRADRRAFNEAALLSIHTQLSRLQSPENQNRATQVRGLLPARDIPQPEPTQPEPAPAAPPPVSSPPPTVTPESSAAEEASSGYQFRAVNFNFHFLDEKLRGFPGKITLGAIPEQGFTHNQSSDFGFNLAAEHGIDGLNFLTGAYYEDMTPTGSPAHFRRWGLRLGMMEYSNETVGVGKKGPGGGGHFSFSPSKRIGFELGSAGCTGIDGQDVSGVECPGSTLQFAVFNQSPLMSGGYGPLEVGVSFLNSKIFLQGDRLFLPEMNRIPLEFNVTYHVNPPSYAFDPKTSEEVLRDEVSNAEVAMTSLDLMTTSFQNNFRRKQEAALQESRLVFFGDQDQFGLMNTGSFLFGIFTGFGEGALAHRLGRDLRHGNKGQRIGLGVLMGTELAVNLIGFAATPGIPDEVQTFPGMEVPEGTDLSGNEGITNLQARAYRLNLPQIALRDTVAVLDAVGAFGDRNKAIRGDSVGYPVAHGVMAAGGVVLMLTAGNGSGTGFFGNSIIGNQPPNAGPGETFQVLDGDYSLQSQSWQYFRHETGAMFMVKGMTGLLDFATGRFKYLDLKDQERKCEEIKKDNPRHTCEHLKKEEPENGNTAGISNFRVGADLGRDRAMGTVSFNF